MHVAHCGASRLFFFFNDTATTEIYTLSLHDALPISFSPAAPRSECTCRRRRTATWRSEEHTSELQSLTNLVCRLLLEKKNTTDGATYQEIDNSTAKQKAKTPGNVPTGRSELITHYAP